MLHHIKDFLFFFLDDTVRGLISVVHEWIKGNYEEKKLYPCWRSVIHIVADSSNVNEGGSAITIAEEWKGSTI